MLASPEAIRPSRRSSEVGDRFGRQVALEEAVRPRHRLQGHAQVEAQVDRLLLPPTALGEVLDGRQRIVVRQDGFLER